MNSTQSSNCKFSIKVLRLGVAFLLLILGTRSLRAENFTNLLREATHAYAQQNYEQAVDLYNKAVELETNNFLAYVGRGGAYACVGEINKAENDFNKAIDLATNNIPLGERNVKKIERVISEIEKQTGAVIVRMEKEQARIFVRLEIPPQISN